jgi:sialidase-1
MDPKSNRRLRLEALEDRQLLSASSYRDLTTPQAPVAPAPPLFNEGDAGYPVFNVPAIVTTTGGTVLAFAEGRLGYQDPTGYAIVMRRSTDGGESWSLPYAAASVDLATGNNINGTCPIVDEVTGDVFLLYTQNSSSVFVVKSSDDGSTWSTPSDITAGVKVTAAGNPGPAGVYPNDPWDWYAVTPGHGIQLQHGDHAGRLLAGADHRLLGGDGTSFSHVVYSDDHGQTWHLGGGMDQSELANDNTNECTLAELNNGNVSMNIRVQSDSVSYRADALSTDGGITWSNSTWNFDLPSRSVEGSLLRLDNNVWLLASLNNSVGVERHEMTIWLSYDEGQSWVSHRTIDFGYAGYSDMTVIGPDTILLIYTRGRTGGQIVGGGTVSDPALTFEEIELAKINLSWLESTAPYQFEWNFNELAPGMSVANDPLPLAQDSGQWDQKGIIHASASPAAQYVAGPNGDAALRLTSSDDEVVLSQGDSSALQFDLNDGYTIETEFRTTDADGVLIGSRPTVKNWTLAFVGGHAQFSVFDGSQTSAITSNAVLSDGAWHQLVAIHDPISKKLKLYVDGYAAATSVMDSSTNARTASDPLDPIVLGAYSTMDSASQLAVDVDMLKITRSALDSSSFLLNSVVGRHLFYAGSHWDTPTHDAAIAPDKTPYLAGYGVVSFASVSSYTKGLNGLMIDIAGAHGTITADDFTFRVGNNNSPILWSAAPPPTEVSVRAGAGVGGSDRVDLIWADNAIRNKWLEVIVRGNDALGGSHTNTGLADSDVFFFGSAVADSGTGETTFVTNSIDEQIARNDPHSAANRATITNISDYNRDGLVNAVDQQLVRNNLTSGATALKRITLTGVGPFAPSAAAASSSVTAPNALAAAFVRPSTSPPAARSPGDVNVGLGCFLLDDSEPTEEWLRELTKARLAYAVQRGSL